MAPALQVDQDGEEDQPDGTDARVCAALGLLLVLLLVVLVLVVVVVQVVLMVVLLVVVLLLLLVRCQGSLLTSPH
jgi:uncharacterized membrane protein